MSEEYKNRTRARVLKFYASQCTPTSSPTKKRKPRSRSSNSDEWTEKQIQCAVAVILDKLGVLWCHVPNEGKRNVISGARLRAAGMKRGVPDIFIYSGVDNPEQKLLFENHRGVAIELKRTKGGRLTDHQKQWLSDLSDAGWYTATCHGYTDTIDLLKKLGFLNTEET